MNDTSPEIAQKMHEMMQQKSGEERVMMGFSMNASSRFLVTQGILHNEPDISPAELRKRIFLIYYGNDFSSEEKEKILDYLEKNTSYSSSSSSKSSSS